ncbi:putative cytochrome P450 [Glonium stellatum]|uniref:Putative cytochrome P450 n=1 Tax=Glonium stellatum TaxID=574774 RepID=A0A8E2F5W7_9PEZI|nr:putative cytochrome P450 [Glonium stellatum]
MSALGIYKFSLGSGGSSLKEVTTHNSTAKVMLVLLYIITILVLAYTFVITVYNLYFHPLAAYPGPFLARSTLLWRIYHSMGGRFHIAIDRQHRKYGSVFRVSPNELSFASVESWKSIYGHPPAGKPSLIKSEFYEMYGAGFSSLCIGSERDPQKHNKMRKSLSAAFSTKALSEQEDIVTKTIDKFVIRIGKDGGLETGGLNMTKWYEMIAFDILGEMAFGESFHCMETGKPHFWSELILDHLYFITLADNLRRFPLVRTFAKLLFPSTVAVRNQNSVYSRDQVSKRLGKKTSRKDFLTNLVGKLENGEIEREEMNAHVSTLVIAGGETVATFLAATTFYLLKSIACYGRLREEIRNRFASYGEINAASAQQLPYLQAVISEGLRIYPPGSQGFPRVSPGVFVDGRWVPKGAEIYTSAWTVTHDERNFQSPMTFKPERWLDPNSKDIKEASQPFSLGTRGCLGRNFAYMEINLILAKMLWKYNLELLNPDMDWEGKSYVHVMWWKPEVKVRFLERKIDG